MLMHVRLQNNPLVREVAVYRLLRPAILCCEWFGLLVKLDLNVAAIGRPRCDAVSALAVRNRQLRLLEFIIFLL